MTEPALRGTLSAYAKWAHISIQAACMRNKRGQIVMCDDFPHLVDFMRSNMAVNHVGAPRKKRADKKFQATVWCTLQQWEQIQRILNNNTNA